MCRWPGLVRQWSSLQSDLGSADGLNWMSLRCPPWETFLRDRSDSPEWNLPDGSLGTPPAVGVVVGASLGQGTENAVWC